MNRNSAVARKPVVDIYIVGLGMFELRHMTLETLEVLKRASIVYHLSDRHEELCEINRNTQNLGNIYTRSTKRTDIYRQIASFIVNSAHRAAPTVFAIDGNPMFFNDISWNIAALAKKRQLHVEVLPGISCIDVLPMQLGFEPADVGLQIFEATQLVLYNLPINSYLSTLILQVGYFFVRKTSLPPKRKPGAFTPLALHLAKFFPGDHPAVFIQSASSRSTRTIVFWSEIGSIDKFRNEITPTMTLYLPRIGVPELDSTLCKELDLR